MTQNNPDHDHHELEIVKAVAQAWFGHSSSSRTANEFDANLRNFKSQPSRFKLEAMNRLSTSSSIASPSWDFRESLWDSYEIVTVSKKLETGLTFDDSLSGLEDDGLVKRRIRRTESKNSLRNLFNRLSSRRFSESRRFPGKDNDYISFD